MKTENGTGAVAQGEGGWWIAQIGVDFIDSAVLKSACNENQLMHWDGVVGRFGSEAEAERALAAALAE